MNQKKNHSVFVFCILFCVSTLITSITLAERAVAQVDPNLLNLGIEALKSIKEAKDAYGNIEDVRKVVKDIEDGKTPSVTENKWSDLANKYKVAAEHLRNASLSTEFDKSKYSFSFDELKNCDTRQASLTKAKGYLKELKDALERGKTSQADLDLAQKDVDSAKQALKYLIDVHEKLMNVPIYGEIFQWDWFELNTSVSKSLGELQSALSSRRQRLQNSINLINQYIPNLESNLSLLEKLSCSLAAHWKGSANSDGKTLPMAILVTQNNEKWEGQINIDDEGDNFRNTEVQGRNISFVVGQPNRPFTFKGTMSQDGTTLSGTFSSSEANGSFSLSRQPN